ILKYFYIAKSQGWMSSSNYLIISNEYKKIKEEFKPMIGLTLRVSETDKKDEVIEKQRDIKIIEEKIIKNIEIDSVLPDRQIKIVDFLRQKGKAQVMDLQTILPKITKRTIRRDLDNLLELRKIVRVGDFNQISYKLA
ncbi:MAG: DeoR family transcriptional regulator, partial [Candidatus Staskawiczbacteria bacterium]|nr:DeoR family transcriptional regulator [Candidatus Staskawiczbacteria bacterium]